MVSGFVEQTPDDTRNDADRLIGGYRRGLGDEPDIYLAHTLQSAPKAAWGASYLQAGDCGSVQIVEKGDPQTLGKVSDVDFHPVQLALHR